MKGGMLLPVERSVSNPITSGDEYPLFLYASQQAGFDTRSFFIVGVAMD